MPIPYEWLLLQLREAAYARTGKPMELEKQHSCRHMIWAAIRDTIAWYTCFYSYDLTLENVENDWSV